MRALFSVMDEPCPIIVPPTQRKNKVPSGRGFGFSNPPSCMSSKAKETLRTWKEKHKAKVMGDSLAEPWVPQGLFLGKIQLSSLRCKSPAHRRCWDEEVSRPPKWPGQGESLKAQEAVG